MLIGVLSGSLGKFSVKFGLRLDFRHRSVVAVIVDSWVWPAGSEPGAGVDGGMFFGGSGCGGWLSFGRVYC